MISRQEVMELSREFGLTANVIEKDYVLGWILAGINHHPELTSDWVFKGGTCLKKCYFETYRFSEDLDFTLTNQNHIDEDFLISVFQNISDWVYDTTGIEIPKENIRFEIYQNPRGALSAEGRINYRGPMQPGGSLPRIKLDLTIDEILVLDPVIQPVHHPYSDKPEGGINIKCYCYEELFAEKIRALGERERPRDLYDIINIYRYESLKPNREILMDSLEQKCTFKEVSLPNIELLESKPERQEIESEWENMLAHQLPILPPFIQFWQELPQVFEWLYHAIEKVLPASAPINISIDESWAPPVMAQPWNLQAPLELIRFAATNRLCVIIDYIDAKENRKETLIEPYALRKSNEGNILLFAVKHLTGEDRSYRVDRIQNVEVTKDSYSPRYIIELKDTRPVDVPMLNRSSGTQLTPKKKNFKPGVSGRNATQFHYSPTYILECSLCGKKFNRKEFTTKLNPHKDKSGYPCMGRIGLIVDTKY